MKRGYAARVLTASMALEKSFFDIFGNLVKVFPPDEAYTLTERSKRGLQDTSQPGGFIQDHIFLAGKKKVETLPTDALRMLYTGKIAIAHLPLARQLLSAKKLVAPAFLPDSFHG